MKTVRRINCAIDWIDDALIHAQLIHAVNMPNVHQQIMELNAVVRKDSLGIHTSSVDECKDVELIQSVHQAKHVWMANAVHHVNVEFLHCVKWSIINQFVDVRMVILVIQQLDVIRLQMHANQIHVA